MTGRKSTRSVKDHVELKLSSGEVVKVHRVPQSVTRGVVPDTPRPRQPVIEMETKAGPQKRAIKSDDPGWEEYQEAVDEWNEQKVHLQEDVSLCMALKSYPFPAGGIVFDDDMMALVKANMLVIPENEYSKKAMWLRTYVISAYNDELEIDFALQEMSGVPTEVIDEMKENFRRSLLGQNLGGVAEDTTSTDTD